MLLVDKLGIPQVVNTLPTLNTSEQGWRNRAREGSIMCAFIAPLWERITSKFKKHKQTLWKLRITYPEVFS